MINPKGAAARYIFSTSYSHQARKLLEHLNPAISFLKVAPQLVTALERVILMSNTVPSSHSVVSVEKLLFNVS